jgi:fatty acid desaturase
LVAPNSGAVRKKLATTLGFAIMFPCCDSTGREAFKANTKRLAMRPRYRADYRTLLWVVLTPGVIVAQFANPALIPYLCWLSCYFALANGVIAHNHNHCPTFSHKLANQVFANWISIFYGYPTFAWIPTHNMNHHRCVNRPGDATITWRLSNRHNLLLALTYFFVSSYWQSGPINAFIRNARLHNRRLYWRILTQYGVWAGAHIALLATAVAIYGFGRGARVYLIAGFVPALFALWTIMLFNYEQHVHADLWSSHNHSRSWDGKLLNFLLFNNGLHAAHHEMPGLHWSELPALHAALARDIDPRLVNHGVIGYIVRQYILGAFMHRYRTSQIGRGPFDPPQGYPSDLQSSEFSAASR